MCYITLLHVAGVCYAMACAFFALMVVPRSCIKFGWLIYLVVCPNEIMPDRLVNTCSVGYNKL